MNTTTAAHSSAGKLLAFRWDNWRLALLATLIGVPLSAFVLPNFAAVVATCILGGLLVITSVVYSWTRHVGGLLVAPAIAVLVVMNIFPLLWSLGLSFYNYRADRQSLSFIGLRNYERLLSDPVVWERLTTTATLVVLTVAVQMVVGFLFALLFSKQFPLRRYLLILVLTPMMLSYVAVGAFFRYYYDPTFGLVSQVVNMFTDEPFVLISSTGGAIAAIVIADAWMWAPFVMLLVLAGLVSVPKHLYEAASIDRVPAWRRFWSITFPYVKGLLMLALLFRTIEAFKLFDVVFILTDGGQSTETIALYVYRQAIQFNKTSYSASLSYILLFTVIVLTNLYLYLANRRTKEG
ncbi:MAG: ABC transporter permease [Blastopirellula sp.]|nr:MAG: ABC transporter permease [Blastopirellula sp.]